MSTQISLLFQFVWARLKNRRKENNIDAIISLEVLDSKKTWIFQPSRWCLDAVFSADSQDDSEVTSKWINTVYHPDLSGPCYCSILAFYLFTLCRQDHGTLSKLKHGNTTLTVDDKGIVAGCPSPKLKGFPWWSDSGAGSYLPSTKALLADAQQGGRICSHGVISPTRMGTGCLSPSVLGWES